MSIGVFVAVGLLLFGVTAAVVYRIEGLRGVLIFTGIEVVLMGGLFGTMYLSVNHRSELEKQLPKNQPLVVNVTIDQKDVDGDGRIEQVLSINERGGTVVEQVLVKENGKYLLK